MKYVASIRYAALAASIAQVAICADIIPIGVKDSVSSVPVQADVMVLGKPPGRVSEIVTRRTDPNEALEVDLTQLSRTTVVVRAPGYGVRCLTGDQLESSSLEVALPRAIRLVGTVEGRELPSAIIKAVHPEHAACAIRLTYFEEPKTSGNNGRYMSNEIDAGSDFSLIVQRPGFKERRISRAEIPLSPAAEVGTIQEFDIVLQPE